MGLSICRSIVLWEDLGICHTVYIEFLSCRFVHLLLFLFHLNPLKSDRKWCLYHCSSYLVSFSRDWMIFFSFFLFVLDEIYFGLAFFKLTR